MRIGPRPSGPAFFTGPPLIFYRSHTKLETDMDDPLIDLLVGFAAQNRKALVDYAAFLEYAEKYAYDNNLTDIIRKLRDDKIEIVPTLMQWEYKGFCTIFRKESVVESVLVHSLLKEQVNDIYVQIEQNAEIPFPPDAQFGFPIPERLMFTVDVKKEFINFLTDIDAIKQPLIKIVFPEGVKNLIVAKDVVKTRLIECAMFKLGRYLQYKMNVSYVNNRLETLLSGNVESIKTTINDIIAKPKKIIQLFYDGDNFTFRFFSQFTALILKDYADKKTKHEDEQGFLQSSYMLGLFVGYQKSLAQREYQRELELNQLEKQVRKPPYAFSLNDLYNLKDSHGVRYRQKYNNEFIQEFIRRMTKAGDPKKLPSLLSVKISDEKDVFIHKDFVIPLFLNGLKEASSQLYREYIDEWQTLLKNNTRLPSMKYDHEFITELNFKIKQRYTLVGALRNPQLLSVIKDEKDPNDPQKAALDLCFAREQTLKSIDELLDLKRDKIMATVKTLLPAWYIWPVIKHVFFLFKWLLGRSNRSFKVQALRLWREVKGEFKRGADKEYSELIASKKNDIEKEEAEVTRKEAVAKFRTQLETLKSSIIGAQANIDDLLDDLKEKWNPLFDAQAKDNLVEDVNSFIRDYIRSVKRTYRLRAPTPQQVREMAAHLSGNRHLQAIKKKETLRMYIEAYIIKVLEEQYHLR
jgi:hypothetical protein